MYINGPSELQFKAPSPWKYWHIHKLYQNPHLKLSSFKSSNYLILGVLYYTNPSTSFSPEIQPDKSLKMLSISLTGATGAIFLLSTIQIAVAAPLYNADIVSNPLQGGYKNVAYYCDWWAFRFYLMSSKYSQLNRRAASFQPHQMPVDKLTHVLHSFAVPQDDGTM
jgi:hypothetical protein